VRYPNSAFGVEHWMFVCTLHHSITPTLNYSTCFASVNRLVFYLLAFVTFLPTLGARAADSPKPQYVAWGFDLAGADTKTKPGDDFFRYANGTWIAFCGER
jgi:hypothetical protein